MNANGPYRDPAAVQRLARDIQSSATRPWRLMEICGGQTHAIARYGIEALLPPGIALAHGPGCPVCVTPLTTIDQALAIARLPRVTFCTFGDMLRVPGSTGDLYQARAEGADLRVVYSPLDALAIAQREPRQQVVFFAIGFETTAPANALAVEIAARRHIENLSFLVSQALVPPAIETILAGPNRNVDGFLAAGHVCVICGQDDYRDLAQRRRVPIVVTGFEPVDILRGVLRCIQMLETGRFETVNEYRRAVSPEGNRQAQALIRQVFQIVDRNWRGIGPIPRSGLALRPAYRRFDATERFSLPAFRSVEPTECIAGRILQGAAKPTDCPLFAAGCSPDRPLGAPMVSSEGACAAYYQYRRPPTPAVVR